jgi:menaquinone-specific isochorismate synthase
MQTAFAFLQTGADRAACAAAPLRDVAAPTAGRPAFFAPPFSFDAAASSWMEPASGAVEVISRDAWRRRFPPPPARPAAPRWSAPDERRFAAGFRSLVARLEDGSLRKGVPVTAISAPVEPESADAIFDHLLGRVPDLPAPLFAYGFYRPASDTVTGSPEFLVGATPELLFDLDEAGRLSTMAVAGTRRIGGPAASLASRPKDRDEHQRVVDDLVEQLGAWGRPAVSETTVRRFGELEHLVADIGVDAGGGVDFETAARRLHPTPALGVYPRGEAGAAWLAGIDPRGERRRFGAPFGLRWPSGAGRCVVAIRGLQYHDGRLEIWAGCGVVSGSRYEDEWREVLDKMQAVRTLWRV